MDTMIGDSLAFAENYSTEEKAPTSFDLMRPVKVALGYDIQGNTIEQEIGPREWREMKANFENDTRGVEIAFDYGHDHNGPAAGWIKNVEITDEDGENPKMTVGVKWTPKAEKSIVEGEWRYRSPEFMLNYRDEDTKRNMGAVLLGAGLTNRPHIKDMSPLIRMAEKTGGKVTEKEMAEKIKSLEEDNKKKEKMIDEYKKASGGDKKKKMEEDEEKEKMEKKKKMNEISVLEDKLACSEKIVGAVQMFSEGKITAKQLEILKEITDPSALDSALKFAEVSGGEIKTKTIGKSGSGSSGFTNSDDFVKKMNEHVYKLNDGVMHGDNAVSLARGFMENAGNDVMKAMHEESAKQPTEILER